MNACEKYPPARHIGDIVVSVNIEQIVVLLFHTVTVTLLVVITADGGATVGITSSAPPSGEHRTSTGCTVNAKPLGVMKSEDEWRLSLKCNV